MKIIGAGFGRTGTLSLKKALEELGFGPCYHMVEVIKNWSHSKYWQAAADGRPVDWGALFEKYQSSVDYPASIFYREIYQAFPNAKILLSVRDPQRWYQSTLETIYTATKMPNWMKKVIPFIPKMVDDVVWDGIFEGRFENQEFAIEVFNQWIETTKQNIPADRLLIFDVKEGWEPLCKFLDVPVPDTPFPHVNDRVTMKRILLTGKFVSIGIPIALVLGILWALLN